VTAKLTATAADAAVLQRTLAHGDD